MPTSASRMAGASLTPSPVTATTWPNIVRKRSLSLRGYRSGVSVVRRDALRRWALVGAAVIAVCLAPVAIAAIPRPGAQMDPARVRDLIKASADRPYQGYVDVDGYLGLPDLPGVDQFTGLLSGSTRLRAWYATPSSWRVAELTTAGETDTYRTADSTYVWDFARNLYTRSIGDTPRLPRSADLLPPNLSRRLLDSAGTVSPLAGQRIAGVNAVGVTWTPSDPDTTVGRVDIWADPHTGLPLRILVAGRGAGKVFDARFQQVDQRAPAHDLLIPSPPASAGYTVTTAQDLASAINGVANGPPLPVSLAGRARVATPAGVPGLRGLAAYGQGVSAFATVIIPGRTGAQTIQRLHDAGAVPVVIGNAEAYEMATPLVNVLVLRTPGTGRGRRTYLLAGTVAPEVLRQAAAELVRQ